MFNKYLGDRRTFPMDLEHWKFACFLVLVVRVYGSPTPLPRGDKTALKMQNN